MPNRTTEELDFGRLGRRYLQANFQGGDLSSNGGLMLLRQIDARTGLSRRAAKALTDRRAAARIHHRLREVALRGTELERASAATIRVRLLMLSPARDKAMGGKLRLRHRKIVSLYAVRHRLAARPACKPEKHFNRLAEEMSGLVLPSHSKTPAMGGVFPICAFIISAAVYIKSIAPVL